MRSWVRSPRKSKGIFKACSKERAGLLGPGVGREMYKKDQTRQRIPCILNRDTMDFRSVGSGI